LNTNSKYLENFKETTKVPYIKLQSSEGEVFTVETEIAKKSGTIRSMSEDLGVDEGGDNTYILKKIPFVTSRTHLKPGFDSLRVEQGTLFEIMLAANHLDTKGFSDVTCTAVANMMAGKSPEEIRKTCKIKKNFNPAWEEQIRNGLFKYYISKEVGGWGGQLLTIADKMGGWGWPNADVSKKSEKRDYLRAQKS
jgi:S-phase kinase-associated protein 1